MNTILRDYRSLDFQSDGQPVKGIQLFISFPELGVEGEMTDSAARMEAYIKGILSL